MPERAVIQVQVRTDAEELEGLEGDLRRVEEGAERVTPIDVDAQTSEATQGLNAVRDGFVSATRQAEEAQQSIRSVGTSADQAQSQLSEAIEQAEGDFRGLGLRAERTGDQIRQVATGIQLDAGTQQARESLRRLEGRAQDFVQSVEAPAQVRLDATGSEEVLRRLGRRAEQTETRLRDLSAAVTIDADTDQARRSLARLDGAVEEFVSDVSQASPIRVRADTAAARRQLARTDREVGGLVESAQRVSGVFEDAGLHSAQAIGQIGRSAEDAISSVEGLRQAQSRTFNELAQRTGQARTATDSMEAAFADLGRRAELTAQDLQEATLEQRRFSSSAQTMGRSATGAANALGFELVQAAQDARFGMAGVANQIPLIAEQFGRMRRQAGSTTGALSRLGSSFLGPAGIIGAITLGLPLIQQLVDGLFSAGEAADEAASGASGANREFQGLFRTVENRISGLEDFRSELEKIGEQELELAPSAPGPQATPAGFRVSGGTQVATEDLNNLREALNQTDGAAGTLRATLGSIEGLDVRTIMTGSLEEARAEVSQFRDQINEVLSAPGEFIRDRPEAFTSIVEREFRRVQQRQQRLVKNNIRTQEQAVQQQVEFLESTLTQASDAFSDGPQQMTAQLRRLRDEVLPDLRAKVEQLSSTQSDAADEAGRFANANVGQIGQALQEGVIQTSNEAESAISRLNERLGETADEQQRQRILVLRRRVKQLKTEFETLDASGLEGALSAMREMGILQERLSFQDVFGGQPTRVQDAAGQLQRRLQRLSQRPFLPQAAKADRQVQAVISSIQALQQEGELLSEEALRGFLRDLDLSASKVQTIIDRLREAGTAGQSMAVSIREQIDRAIRAREIGFGEMAQQAGQQAAQSLRQALVRGEISPQEFNTLNRKLRQAGFEGTKEGTADGLSTGAQIGANAFQGVMSTAISEITRDIENNFARAITSAVLQALSSAAVERLTSLLSKGGDDSGTSATGVAQTAVSAGGDIFSSLQGGGGETGGQGGPSLQPIFSLLGQGGGTAASGAGASGMSSSFLPAMGPTAPIAGGTAAGGGAAGGAGAAGGLSSLAGAGPIAGLLAAFAANRALAGLFGDPEGTGENILATALPPVFLGGSALGLFAEGGPVRHPGVVRGPGGPRDDKIPAMLSDGEFVVQAPSAMNAPGLMRAINEDPQRAQQVERLMQEQQLAEAALASQTGREPRGLAQGGFASARHEPDQSPQLPASGSLGASGGDTIGRTVDYDPGAAGSPSTPQPAPEVTTQAPAPDLDPIKDELSRQTESLNGKLDNVAQRVEKMQLRLDTYDLADKLKTIENEKNEFTAT